MVFMGLISILYFMLLVLCTRKVAAELTKHAREEVEAVRTVYDALLTKKEEFYAKKMDMETAAIEVYTLYEITKDITKSHSEEEAFDIFQQKLRKNVQFGECLLLESKSPKIKEYRKSPTHFVFSLKEKRKRIGYLVVSDVDEEDQEKVMILGHQFALALRRVRLYKEIERLAITDSLTEVYTRRYCLERFDEELNRASLHKTKLSVLMVDVDFFKSFNDKYGHLTGDRILHEIGKIINKCIRTIDIAGRYGGEEFCIVLPDTDQEGAKYAAERIRQSAESAVIKAYDATVTATLSIGVATFPKDAKERDELIDKADWALYRAKKLGRNQVCSFGVFQ